MLCKDKENRPISFSNVAYSINSIWFDIFVQTKQTHFLIWFDLFAGLIQSLILSFQAQTNRKNWPWYSSSQLKWMRYLYFTLNVGCCSVNMRISWWISKCLLCFSPFPQQSAKSHSSFWVWESKWSTHAISLIKFAPNGMPSDDLLKA